jgi:hypothetical protein
MATPTGFQEANKVLNAPEGEEASVLNLPVVSVPGMFTGSVWELTNAELQTIFKTGKIFLGVFYGGETQPPVFLTAYQPGVPLQLAEAFRKQTEDGTETGNANGNNG